MTFVSKILGFALVAAVLSPSVAHAGGCTVTLTANGNTAAIQHAMDRPGSPVVCLKPGIYKGARLVLQKSGTLRRIGKDRAILDAGGQGRVITIADAGARITFEGITLTQGKSPRGGAISLTKNSRLVLQDCWITGNSAQLQGGGAIYAEAGELELVRTRVSQNTGEGASAIDLTVTVRARFASTLIADNRSQATSDAPVRLSGDASLDIVGSTIAYNSGSGIFLQPLGPGLSRLRVDSSIVMGKPEAIAVARNESERVAVFRSVLTGGIGFIALDRFTIRDIPGFNLVEAERYRPKAGSVAIDLGRCGAVRKDLAGLSRPARCTAGALEAPAADVRATLRERALVPKPPKDASPW